MTSECSDRRFGQSLWGLKHCRNSDTIFEHMAAHIDTDFGQWADTVVTLWIGFEKVVRGSVMHDTLTFEDSAAIAQLFRKNCPMLTGAASGCLAVYPEPVGCTLRIILIQM